MQDLRQGQAGGGVGFRRESREPASTICDALEEPPPEGSDGEAGGALGTIGQIYDCQIRPMPHFSREQEVSMVSIAECFQLCLKWRGLNFT